jgi:hypothetical protein
MNVPLLIKKRLESSLVAAPKLFPRVEYKLINNIIDLNTILT